MTQTGRRLIALCAFTLLMTACSKPPAPVQTPPVSTAPVAAPGTAPAAPVARLREQALALMDRGDLTGAIAKWQELAARDPSADNWNDLSYAQLLAGQYKDAAASAEQALRLDSNHAAAQYNAGMAYLESRDSRAEWFLDNSARSQPDRFEPLIGLARVALAQGRGPLAAHYLAEARRLPGGEAEAARLQPSVDALNAPAPAPAACVAQLADGPVTLCLAQGTKHHELYRLTGQGDAQRITVGIGGMHPALEKGALPDGGVVYWLKSSFAVVDIYRWQGFVVRAGKLQQLIFKGGNDLGMWNRDDTVKSAGMPRVFGGELAAGHRHEADPSKDVAMRFRLAPDAPVAEQTYFYMGPRGH